MAEYIEREQVVIEREPEHSHSNTQSGRNAGLIIAVVVLGLILLFLLFGRSLLGGSEGGGTTDVNIQPPTNTPSAQ